jgi:hypothetical protein
MLNNELAIIETELRVVLPSRYRGLMLAYPLDPFEVNHRIELQDDAKGIISFNRFLRETFDEDWPEHYFAFGNSPVGDPYFLDLSEGGIAVYRWDHETHEVADEAPDLDQWIAQRKKLP